MSASCRGCAAATDRRVHGSLCSLCGSVAESGGAMTTPDRPFSITAAKVIAVEAVVLLALWLAGRYFAG
jgi:hypothetical protein